MRRRQLVLMVEDLPEEQDLYGKLLWYNGFDVLFTGDGEEALGLARQRRPDLVLLDLMLPGMGGLSFCARLKADPETTAIPVVVLTARKERELGTPARQAGCARFLEKPISPLAVMKVIEELIGRAPPPGELDDVAAGDEPGRGPAEPRRRPKVAADSADRAPGP